jgi:hypothetical protein
VRFAKSSLSLRDPYLAGGLRALSVHLGFPCSRGRCDYPPGPKYLHLSSSGCGGSDRAARCVSVQPVARRCAPVLVPRAVFAWTIGSKHFPPLRWWACRSDWSMLVTMRAHSASPSAIPECSGAIATTPPAAPPALPLLYSDVVWRQSMAITTVVGNLDGGTLAAAVSAREPNDLRSISRNHAPATINPWFARSHAPAPRSSSATCFR